MHHKSTLIRTAAIGGVDNALGATLKKQTTADGRIDVTALDLSVQPAGRPDG